MLLSHYCNSWLFFSFSFFVDKFACQNSLYFPEESAVKYYFSHGVQCFIFILREEAQTQRRDLQVLQFQIPFVAHPALNIL